MAHKQTDDEDQQPNTRRHLEFPTKPVATRKTLLLVRLRISLLEFLKEPDLLPEEIEDVNEMLRTVEFLLEEDQ